MRLEEIRARWGSDDPQKLYISHEEAIYLLRIADAAGRVLFDLDSDWLRGQAMFHQADLLDNLRAALNPVGEEK